MTALMRLVAASSLEMVLLDREGRFLEVSSSVTASTGLRREQLVGQHVTALFSGLDEALLVEALSTPASVTLPPLPIGGPNMAAQWFQSTFTPWWDDDGVFSGVLSITKNITAEQVAQAELARTEALLDAVVESIPSMISVQEVETGDHVRVNRATEEFLGLPRDQILNCGPLERFAENAVASHLAQIQDAAMAQGRMLENEDEMPRADGELRTLHVRRRLIADRSGERHVLTVGDDITERKRAEAALQRAVEEAEAANRAKSGFLAAMSHEVRTPLNGVLGMAQAMARDELSLAQRERLDVIRQSGETLLTILNDILDLSKIEAGRLELEVIDFDLGQVVEGAAAGFAAVAQAKGLALSTETAGAAGTYCGDP
ncbi:MAG: PAS domain S-box protein, partial [Caulobacteraceae bacterium]|nr:PAS domain S-box protein [Caulobacteraceae bacterium]